MKHYAILAVLLFAGTRLQAQEWKNYTCGLSVNCATIYNDTVWIGSNGGVAKLLTDGTMLATYTHADGLSSNKVNCIAVDNQGILWVGTQQGTTAGGVSKFDGNNWTIYNTSNSLLPSNNVYSISVDSTGAKWFGTSLGLTKFDGNNWIIYNSSSFPGLPTTYNWIFTDNKYNLWAHNNATNHFFKLVNGNWVDKGTVISSSGLFFDRQDNLWAIKSAGGPGSRLLANKFDGNNWQSYDYTNSSLPEYAYFAGIQADKDGTIWLGLDYSGPHALYKFDSLGWNFSKTYPDGNLLAIDSSNNKWFGQSNFGVAKYHTLTWHEFNPSASGMPANNVQAIAVDRHNNKWISAFDYGATSNGGFSKFDGVDWHQYSAISSTSKIWAQPNDKIWTGGDEFDGTNWAEVVYPSGGLASTVDHEGNKWFTTASGVYKFDGNWTFYHTEWYNTAIVDPQNNKWFGSWRGLAKFDGTQWYKYDSSNCMALKYFNNMAADNSGNIWVGTQGAGVVKFDGANWTVYNPTNSGLPGGWITAINCDKNGNLWVGSLDTSNSSYKGASKFDGSTWTTFLTQNCGLGSNRINSVVADEQNNIWFGTDYGLSELTSADITYSAWLNFNGNVCNNTPITFTPLVNYGTPPYTFAWQAIGNALSCTNCQNPTAIITQNSVYIVSVTDAHNQVTADTLHVYACLSTAINDIENGPEVLLYPNPGTDLLFVECPNNPISSITIFDMQSRRCAEFKQPGKAGIDISQLNKGMYVVEIQTPNGATRKKWIKL